MQQATARALVGRLAAGSEGRGQPGLAPPRLIWPLPSPGPTLQSVRPLMIATHPQNVGVKSSSSLDAQEATAPLTPEDRIRIREAWRVIDEADEAGEESDPGPESHPLDIQSTAQQIVHRKVREDRIRIVNALWDSCDRTLRSRAKRIGLCVAVPTLRSDAAHRVYPALQRCRDRLCPLCQYYRGKQAAAATLEAVQQMSSPRFVTLTTQGKPGHLVDRMKHLLRSFSRLRQTDFWKRTVRGGVYALEVTWNVKNHHWHPHLHVITDGEFIPHAKLKAEWQRITGDSFIVHVKAVPDRERAAEYIATYVAKPMDLKRWPANRICEYAHTLHGVRMIQPFGTAMKRTEQVDGDLQPEPDKPTLHLCHGSIVSDAAASGSRVARFARDLLARISPYHAATVGREYQAETPEVSPALQRWLTVILFELGRAWPNLAADFDVRFAPSAILAGQSPIEHAAGHGERKYNRQEDLWNDDEDPERFFATHSHPP